MASIGRKPICMICNSPECTGGHSGNTMPAKTEVNTPSGPTIPTSLGGITPNQQMEAWKTIEERDKPKKRDKTPGKPKKERKIKLNGKSSVWPMVIIAFAALVIGLFIGVNMAEYFQALNVANYAGPPPTATPQ